VGIRCWSSYLATMRMIRRWEVLACFVTASCQSPATKSSARVPGSASDTAAAPLPRTPGIPTDGDSAAGIAYVTEYDGFNVVFNHGHFVGVVYNFNNQVRAYRYRPGSMEMHPSGVNFPSIRAAAQSLGSAAEQKRR
jgi:hypothetical protein